MTTVHDQWSARLTAGLVIAFLNPFTPFGRDTGEYWLGAFVLPMLATMCYAGIVVLTAKPHRPLLRFTGIVYNFMLPAIAVSVMILWADQ